MASIVSSLDLYKLVGKSDARSAILRGVSLDVEAGGFVCVMGPSGSGKSTLLHLLSGLDEPSSGKVLLAGQDLSTLSLAARTRLRRDTVGYVFQFFNLLPNLDVLENVGLPLAIAGRRKAEQDAAARPLLERFGLARRARQLPHELSGGEMQRASIARALAGQQPLILADEPTGNLSQKAGLEVMQTLRQVCERDHRSVLLVTHNPRDAAFADRVHFLVDGELSKDVVLEGPQLSVERVHEALNRLAI